MPERAGRGGGGRAGVADSTAGPADLLADRSPEGRAQEKLNKHGRGLFLRTLPDTPIG